MPGGGNFCFVFSTRGPEFCTEKLYRGGILTEKISGPGVSRGGMVTGHIDTCIKGSGCDKGRNIRNFVKIQPLLMYTGSISRRF